MSIAWKDWLRFFNKVHIREDPKGCWQWMGPQAHGKKAFYEGDYGAFRSFAGHTAHRLSFRLFRGDIPKGLEIDHLCRNRPCVNPGHLDLVTRRENLLRGRNANREKTHCPKGHEFTPENTGICRTYGRVVGRKRRRCRTCHREETKAWHRAKAATATPEERERMRADWRRRYYNMERYRNSKKRKEL